MTKKEAEDYIKLVHNIVDGKHIKLESFKYKDVKKFANKSFEHAFKRAPMPSYNHDKYILAKRITSIHVDYEKRSSELMTDIQKYIRSLF